MLLSNNKNEIFFPTIFWTLSIYSYDPRVAVLLDNLFLTHKQQKEIQKYIATGSWVSNKPPTAACRAAHPT